MPDIRIVTVTLNPAVDRVLEAPGFEIGQHTPVRRIAWYPAGKGVNVSRVLAMLSAGSVATGFIGRGELAMFEEHLERVGEGRIITQMLIVRGRTRDNITVVDPVNDTETHLREEGFTVQEEDVARIASKLAMMARPGRIIAFSGSLPPGMTTDHFADIVRRCRRQGARVCVDTSRDALTALRGEDLWMAKLNAEELTTLTGEPAEEFDDAVRAARALAKSGGGQIEHVVASRGAEGSILVGPDYSKRGWVSVHPGLIVSTVGCGDSLLAGILSVLCRDERALDLALRVGIAAATANATRREAGFVDPEEVAAFRELVEIDPLPTE